MNKGAPAIVAWSGARLARLILVFVLFASGLESFSAVAAFADEEIIKELRRGMTSAQIGEARTECEKLNDQTEQLNAEIRAARKAGSSDRSNPLPLKDCATGRFKKCVRCAPDVR